MLVFLYGSYAIGLPQIDSDLDLAVLFSDKIKSSRRKFSLIVNITLQLQSYLGKEVNIISLEKNFPHPMLYYNAIIHGIPMEDFELFMPYWQREVIWKNLKDCGYA